MTNVLAAILKEYPAVVLDGALATELEQRGCDLHDPLWSAKVLMESPQLIRQVHSDYFAAGADCAITASYQATFEGFRRRGLNTYTATELMRLSVQLACEARDAFWANPHVRQGRPQPFVAASVGPYGAFLADGSEYRGDYGLSQEALIAFHRPRLAVLASAGADILACETIPCLTEALALAQLLREFPGTNAWISFSAHDESHTRYGEPIAECVAMLDSYPQIIAVGVNCTAPQHIAGLVRAMRSATHKPILAYPNSGEEYHADTNRWSGESSCVTFGSQAKYWYECGARLIGGCCRTTPDHIREVAAWVRTMPMT